MHLIAKHLFLYSGVMDDSFFTRHSLLGAAFGIVLVIVGFMVMTGSEKLLAVAMGVALVFSGASSLREAFLFATWTGYLRLFTILKGVISVILGLLGIFYAEQSFQVVMTIMGIQMAVSGILSIVNATLVGSMNDVPLTGVWSNGIFSLVLAAILLVAPQAVGKVILVVAGLVLVCFGIVLTMVGWKGLGQGKNPSVVETKAEVIEEKPLDEEK